MTILYDKKLDYTDVLICPRRSSLSSRKDVNLTRKFKFPHSKNIWQGVPIIAANMDGVGTFSMMRSLAEFEALTALHKYHGVDGYAQMDKEHALATFGIREDCQKMVGGFIKNYGVPKLLLIDVANGYIDKFVEFIKETRKISSESIIMAGNVVTPEMAKEVIRAGADIVKVGIGPGAVCTTRLMAGVGYPQLSAVMECAKAVHKLGGYVCADGGCRNPGDVAKAFSAGADFVMLGGMLAGHNEGEQSVVEMDGKKFMEHYGSSSKEAMEKHNGGVASYKASEGKRILVPYKGTVKNTMEEILGGLRSACTYVGAHNLEELPKRSSFVLVNRQLSPTL